MIAPAPGRAPSPASGQLDEATHRSTDMVILRDAFARTGDRTTPGLITAAEVQPGLLIAGREIEYLADGAMEAEIERSMTCGILLDGDTEPMEVPGYAPVAHERHRLTVVGFGEKLPCRRTYRKHQRNRAFGLTIRPHFFDRFGGSVSTGGLRALQALLEPGFHVRHLPRSDALTRLAVEALDHPYAGPLAALFQESLALRFLVETAQLMGEQARLVGEIGRRRYDHAVQARELLDAALVKPPRTLDLARQIGTNVASLQASFRKAFGTTLFGYVRDQRLAMARLLITDHGLGVAEAGYKVGFTNASAFTAAYRRRFGYPPSAERRQRGG